MVTLIHYRPFHNSDSPHLAEIWAAQPRQRGLLQPLSVEMFEQHVLAKPYFDNDGLIVAVDDGQPIGFVHAGFGPTSDEQSLSTQWGVTNLIMVRPSHQQGEVGGQLLARSEDYLRSRGAEVLYGGGIRPLNAFYVGLYGGSEMPGVLDTDHFARELFRTAGYVEIDRAVALERELSGFRAPVDRIQMQIRRSYTLLETIDPAPRTWWEACTIGGLEVLRFDLGRRDDPLPAATARFWMMQSYALAWGVQAAGLFDISVADDRRRGGLATFLLSESFRRLAARGINLIAVQTMRYNSAALAMYDKLGFHEVGHGEVFRKQ